MRVSASAVRDLLERRDVLIEFALRDEVKVVLGFRVEQVAGEHDVETITWDGPSMMREHDADVLQIVAHDPHGSIHQHRPERAAHVVRGELRRHTDVAVRHRHIDAFERVDRERQADQVRAHRLARRRLQSYGQLACCTDSLGKGLELREPRDGPAHGLPLRLGRPRRDIGRDLRDHAGEAELGVKGTKPVEVPAPIAHMLDIELKRHVLAQRNELRRESRVRFVLGEKVAKPLLRDAGQVLVDAIERAELLQQLGRRLRSHRWHPRHVVGAIAHQRQQIAHLTRRHPELRLHLRGAVHLVAHRVPQHDAIGHELHQVLVGSHDDHGQAGLLGALHHRGDDVVCLHPFALKNSDPVGLDELA